MADPYRDPVRCCPACGRLLRAFRGRLACDACEGLFAPIDDLAAAIEDMTGVVPTFEYTDERPGKRPCPECASAMSTFHLRVQLDNELVKAKPELDRCALHGVWFDTDELAEVFAEARAKHPGGSAVLPGRRRGASGTSRGNWAGDERGFFFWNSAF